MTGKDGDGQQIVDQPAAVCSTCGLPIGRAGSMTLWLFQDSRCKCTDGERRSSGSSSVKERLPRQRILNDRYRLLEATGHGATGLVYKAEDLVSSRTVAVKLMRQDITENEAALRRFQQEVHTASELIHQNLGRVRGYGQDRSGQAYIVMDFIEGDNLEEILQRQGKLEYREGLEIFIQICEGLLCAHARSIIHRDIKPSNVIVLHDGAKNELVKIVDFGFAKNMASAEANKLTQTGEVFGSPLYMSPEHCLGEELDVRSDIYSLGCLMYRALTGRAPLEAENVLATVAKQVREEPRSMRSIDAAIGENIDNVVLKCLAKEPMRRYQNVGDLVLALNQVKRGKQVKAPARAAKNTYATEVKSLRSSSPLAFSAAQIVGAALGIIALLASIAGFSALIVNKSVKANATMSVPAKAESKGGEQVKKTVEENKEQTERKVEEHKLEASKIAKPTPTKQPKRIASKRQKFTPRTQTQTARPEAALSLTNSPAKGWMQLKDLRVHK